MKRAGLNYYGFNFIHPAPTEPAWKDKISRWSQLDFASYGLIEAYLTWVASVTRPNFMILASPGASNETDRKFALGGGSSPSLFVHTLPNIRCSPLCQVMEWSGPVLCIQKDPYTFISGVREGYSLLNSENPVVWVIAVEHRLLDPHRAHLVELKLNGKCRFEISEEKGTSLLTDDKDWMNWLEIGRGHYSLPDGLKVESKSKTLNE